MLECTVSLLCDFEPGKFALKAASDWQDWNVDEHGVQMKYWDSETTYSATFLPQIASEQGWNHFDTMKALLRKSGYRGPVNSQVIDNVEIIRYRSSKASVGFDEYKSRIC
jgi:AMMECR1 domain-containing protein